ncbi:MAG: hypothetical protein ACJ8KU_04135 [Chthoniobacterales bacterium]
MKIKITLLGAALLAVGCFWSGPAFAQTATTVTTTNGAFTEYVPGSETMVVRGETGTTPLRYVVSKQTPIVDETGAPVTIERIAPGSPVSIQYTGSGDRLVASRVVVRRAVTATAPVRTEAVTTAPVRTEAVTTAPVRTEAVTTAPVRTEAVTTAPVRTEAVTTPPARTEAVTTAPVTTAPAVSEQQTTTTTTTRPLSHKEKHALKEEREHPGRAAKEALEHPERAAEKAKDDDGD